ncbi:MAG: hypothetical protein R3B47_12180 [Bacteroidia bacterium]
MLDRYPLEGMHLDEEGFIWGRHIIGRSLISSVRLGKKFLMHISRLWMSWR